MTKKASLVKQSASMTVAAGRIQPLPYAPTKPLTERAIRQAVKDVFDRKKSLPERKPAK